MSRISACPTVLALSSLLAWSHPGAARAQAAYAAANGESSILAWEYGFLAADFPEVELALTFNFPIEFGCAATPCRGRRVVFSLFGAAGARKGQQDMFAKLDFSPGYDFGGGIAYVMPAAAERYGLVFMRGTYSTRDRKVIDIGPLLTSLSRLSQRTFAATLGANYAFSPNTVLGLAVEGRRELTSPGTDLPSEYCTPGTSATGQRVLVCADRFLGPLRDLWTGQLRADMSIGAANLGGGDAPARIAITTATALDFVQGGAAEWGVAVGPTVHLEGYPGQPVVTLLAGLRDVLDANPVGAGGSYFADHFLVRLALGIPFRVMAGPPQ